VVKKYGWQKTFGGLAGVAAMTVVAAAVYWAAEQFPRRKDEVSSRRA
jgi:hypothetical protein